MEMENSISRMNLKIIKTYRFEGESDPSDSSILYVMEALTAPSVIVLMPMVHSVIMTTWIMMALL